MFINQLSKEDKNVLAQDLILSGVSKTALSKMKPLEEVLHEEIPYNEEPNTPLEIGTHEGTSGIIPGILKIFKNYNREINETSANYNLGYLNISKIVLDHPELLTDRTIINLDNILLTQETLTRTYRRFALLNAENLINLITQEVQDKMDIIIDIQEKCFSIFDDKELLLEYFHKKDKYQNMQLHDISNNTYIPRDIFFEVLQAKFPGLINYLFEGSWGDSLIDFDSSLDTIQLMTRKDILDFCLKRIHSLSTTNMPSCFNDSFEYYTKELGSFFSNNNLRVPSTYTKRFENKSSFANRVSNVLSTVLMKRVKCVLIKNINTSPILEGAFILDNQIQIYNEYRFDNVQSMTGNTMSAVRKIANEKNVLISVLTKLSPGDKNFKRYKEELSPYFNASNLAKKLESVQVNSSSYDKVLLTAAGCFKTRNDLFEFIALTENIIDTKTNKREINNKNKTDYFSDLVLRFKIVLFNLLKSTKLEFQVSNNYTQEDTMPGTGEDLLLTIERILILNEVLQGLGTGDKSLQSFYEVFSNFIKEVNDEFPLISLIEKLQDTLFLGEDNALDSNHYIPNANRVSRLYKYTKRNTYRVQLQTAQLNQIVQNALLDVPVKNALTTIDTFWEIQESYQPLGYGSSKTSEYVSTSSSNDFFQKLFISLNRDIPEFLNVSWNLFQNNNRTLDTYLDNVRLELLDSTETQEEISLVVFQQLSIRIVDKVNIINTSNNILIDELFKLCVYDDSTIKVQGQVNKFITAVLDRNEEIIETLNSILINNIPVLNLTIPTFNGYQETITDSTYRLKSYIESTQLSLLYGIVSRGNTELFKKNHEGGSFVKSTSKLIQRAWGKLQTLAPLVNNILNVLAEASYHTSLNNTNLGKVFEDYTVQRRDELLEYDGYRDFQEHLSRNRDRYYLDYRDKMQFFIDSPWNEGTTETFIKDNIYLDWERYIDEHGDEDNGEKFCPVFRDFFMYNDFKYVINGTVNNLGMELNEDYRKSNLISRILSLGILPVHSYRFNVFTDNRGNIKHSYNVFSPKKNYGSSEVSNLYKNTVLTRVYNFKKEVLQCIEEAFQEFKYHKNIYYRRLGSTLNDLIDPESAFYSHSQLQKWVTSSWKDMPFIWNLDDYFLEEIPLENIAHILLWGTEKGKVLELFFSRLDYEKLLSKKFKFKTYLYQELINLFFMNHLNPDCDTLQDKLPLDFNPGYDKPNSRFQELNNQRDDNVVTEEFIVELLHNPDTGLIPNLDVVTEDKLGFGHYLKYYAKFFERHMRSYINGNGPGGHDDPYEFYKNQMVHIMNGSIKNGNVGIPAGISLNCFRNELEGTKNIFINLFTEPSLTNLVPIEFLMDTDD